MKLLTNFLVLALLTLGTAPTHAQDFTSGLTLRYFQFTQAEEPSAATGLGYSVKINQWSLAVELGGPLDDVFLEGDDTVGELDLYLSTNGSWEKMLTNKLAFRLGGSLGNYIVTSSRLENGFFITETKSIRTLEPRIALGVYLTDAIDITLYGGYLIGTESVAEPTAGAYLRAHFF